MSLAGQITVVTGASRGIGRGIALQLGEAGATVYVTGRQPSQSDSTKIQGLPQLEETANEITARGGRGIAVYVDHSNMDDVKAFFDRIEQENEGQLDILVNNAYSAVHAVTGSIGKKFFECPPEIWDEVNNVGLRNHYFCSVYASRIMDKRKKGLIVNVTSSGGIRYLFNVAYGVGKTALDRMTADMAVELEKSNVCVISLCPGAVRTELIQNFNETDEAKARPEIRQRFLDGETVEYSGKAVVALATDKERMKSSGKILLTADLGDKYRFVDIDGRHPPNLRSLSELVQRSGYKYTASWIPKWINIPGWLISAYYSRL